MAKIGMVGYGGIAKKHENVAISMGHEVVSIVDPLSVADDRFSTLHEMLKSVDGVVMCVPVGLRRPSLDIILESGKPLLIEKPLALSPKEAEMLCSSKVVFADNWVWSAPEFGMIGKNSDVDLAFQGIGSPQYWVQNILVGGGAITEGGCYILNWWNFWLKNSGVARIVSEYDGNEMQGVLQVASDVKNARLVIRIDWTGNGRYGSGGYVKWNGLDVKLDWDALEMGFVYEWKVFTRLMNDELTDWDKENIACTLQAGEITTYILWESVIKKLA
jgi:predicted dehydrogenase